MIGGMEKAARSVPNLCMGLGPILDGDSYWHRRGHEHRAVLPRRDGQAEPSQPLRVPPPQLVRVPVTIPTCALGSGGGGRNGRWGYVRVRTRVNVNVFSLGLSNATEEQQAYSAIQDMPMLQGVLGNASILLGVEKGDGKGLCAAWCVRVAAVVTQLHGTSGSASTPHTPPDRTTTHPLRGAPVRLVSTRMTGAAVA